MPSVNTDNNSTTLNRSLDSYFSDQLEMGKRVAWADRSTFSASQAQHLIPGEVASNPDNVEFFNALARVTEDGSGNGYYYNQNSADNGVRLPNSAQAALDAQPTANSSGYYASVHNNGSAEHGQYNEFVGRQMEEIRDQYYDIAEDPSSTPEQIGAAARRSANQIEGLKVDLRNGQFSDVKSNIKYFVHFEDPILNERSPGYEDIRATESNANERRVLIDGISYSESPQDFIRDGRVGQSILPDGSVRSYFDDPTTRAITNFIDSGPSGLFGTTSAVVIVASVAKLARDYFGREDFSLQETLDFIASAGIDTSVLQALAADAAFEVAFGVLSRALGGPIAIAHTGYELVENYGALRAALQVAEIAFDDIPAIQEINENLTRAEDFIRRFVPNFNPDVPPSPGQDTNPGVLGDINIDFETGDVSFNLESSPLQFNGDGVQGGGISVDNLIPVGAAGFSDGVPPDFSAVPDLGDFAPFQARGDWAFGDHLPDDFLDVSVGTLGDQVQRDLSEGDSVTSVAFHPNGLRSAETTNTYLGEGRYRTERQYFDSMGEPTTRVSQTHEISAYAESQWQSANAGLNVDVQSSVTSSNYENLATGESGHVNYLFDGDNLIVESSQVDAQGFVTDSVTTVNSVTGQVSSTNVTNLGSGNAELRVIEYQLDGAGNTVVGSERASLTVVEDGELGAQVNFQQNQDGDWIESNLAEHGIGIQIGDDVFFGDGFNPNQILSDEGQVTYSVYERSGGQVNVVTYTSYWGTDAQGLEFVSTTAHRNSFSEFGRVFDSFATRVTRGTEDGEDTLSFGLESYELNGSTENDLDFIQNIASNSVLAEHFTLSNPVARGLVTPQGELVFGVSPVQIPTPTNSYVTTRHRDVPAGIGRTRAVLQEGVVIAAENGNRVILWSAVDDVLPASKETEGGSVLIEEIGDSTNVYFVVDDRGDTNPDNDIRLDAGQVGSIFGSGLASLIVDDEANLFQTQVSNIVLSTIGDNVAETLAIYATEGTFGEAIDRAFDDYGVEFTNATIGVASSLLVNSIIDDLGLNDASSAYLGAIGSDIVSSYTQSLLPNGGTFNYTYTDLYNVSVDFVASYIGREIGKEVYEVRTREGQITASIGASIGAQYGSTFGPIGTAIGAAVGYIVGGIFGDLFGDEPASGADVVFNYQTRTFEVVNAWSRDGGSRESAEQFAGNTADILNGALDLVGGDVFNEGLLSGGSYGFEGQNASFRIAGRRSERVNGLGNPDDARTYGVINTLSEVDIVGGDTYSRRALYNSAERILNSITYIPSSGHRGRGFRWDIPDDAISILMGDLAVALEYRTYLENQIEYDLLSATLPNSLFAQTHYAILTRAYELGLHRRDESDHLGGWEFTFGSALLHSVGEESAGFEWNQVSFNFSDVELSYQNNERLIHINQQGGEPVIVSDIIDTDKKEELNFTSQTNLDAAIDNFSLLSAALIIQGSELNDVINSGDLGNDVFGNGGDDVLTGGENSDWLDGGIGNDTLNAGGGNNNVLFGREGIDTLNGGDGTDWLSAGSGADFIYAGDGNDVLEGGTGNDHLEGQSGDDVYIFRRGDGADIISDRQEELTDVVRFEYRGTPLGDEYYGQNGEDWSASVEVDKEHIPGGDDVIEFGEGIGLEHLSLNNVNGALVISIRDNNGQLTSDQITIENWSERHSRVERLRFADGQEFRLGNFDSFFNLEDAGGISFGSHGNDLIFGSDGADEILALLGDDTVYGGLGNDIVSGDGDNDIVVGGIGEDNLNGGTGNDIVTGDQGDDTVRGGEGQDILSGGQGNDTIITGAGNDTVIFSRGDGHDIIFDAETTNSANVNLVWSAAGGFANGYVEQDVFEFIDGQRVLRESFFSSSTYLSSDGAFILSHGNLSEAYDSGEDAIEFDIGISLEHIRFNIDGDDLVVGIDSGSTVYAGFDSLEDTITIKDWFGITGPSIEAFRTLQENEVQISLYQFGLGGEGDDVLSANTGEFNWIVGGEGDDQITVGVSGSIVNAGVGNDVIQVDSTLSSGGSGDFGYVYGGEGVDTLDYSLVSHSVNVSLTTGVQTSEVDDEYRNFISIENVIGTSYDDTIIGDFRDNEIHAGPGNDRVVGGLGDDRYVFNQGDGVLTVAELDDSVGVTAASGLDSVVFGREVDLRDLRFVRAGSDLNIHFVNSSDQVILENWYTDPSMRVEGLVFASGLALNIESINFDGTSTGAPDWLNVVDGADAEDVFGGAGGDFIVSGSGGSAGAALFGEDGDDTFYIGLPNGIHIDGGRGTDTIIVDPELDGVSIHLDRNGSSIGNVENVITTFGDDVITGNQYSNYISSSGGDDLIRSGSGADTIESGFGNDIVYSGDQSDTVNAGEGADIVYGGRGNDVIQGGGGNDSLYGEDGDDELFGYSGVNHLYGGQGRDILWGGINSDHLEGGSEEDSLRAGDGDDTLYGGSHDDALFGEQGDDTLLGEDGADYLSGGIGGDTLTGGTGDDVIDGDAGNDQLEGNSGNDSLDGGSGNDTIYGGSGSDFLIGGQGNDILYGEGDTDYYIFSGDFGQDIVEESIDRVETDELIFSGISSDSLWFEESGSDLIISVIGTGNRVTVTNFSRFRINSEAAGEVISRLEQALGAQTSVGTIATETQVLDATRVFELVDAMSAYQIPVDEASIPDAVIQMRSDVWQEHILEIQGRVESAPELNDSQVNIQEGSLYSGQVVASDLNDGDVLTYELVDGPQHGQITLNADGSYEFLANTDFNGISATRIRVSDQTGRSTEALLQFNILSVNDAPEVRGRVRVETTEGASSDIILQFEDPDNAISEYSLEHNSTLGDVAINADGRVVFTPDGIGAGSEQFTLTLSHANGDEVSTLVDLNISDVNHRPESPESVEIENLNVNQRVVGFIPVVDLDDQDGHVYEVLRAGFGTVINLIDGQFEYQPDTNFIGVDRFTIRVTDTSGNANSFTDTEVVLHFNNVNGSPVSIDGPLYDNTNEDTSYTASVGISDPDLVLGDTLNYSANPHHGAVSFDGHGNFTYTPDANFNGFDRFIITAQDQSGLSASRFVELDISPVNDAPILLETPTGDIIRGDIYPYETRGYGLYIDDIDSRSQLVFSGSSSMGELTIYGSSISYTPNEGAIGVDRFTVDITDVDGSVVQRQFEITVLPSFDVLESHNSLEVIDNAGDDGGEILVGQINVYDRQTRNVDPNQEHYSYSLPVSETRFRIDTQGRIYSIGSDFDIDIDSFHDINVSVSNIAHPAQSITRALRVNVLDSANYVTVTLELDASVDEETPIGTIIGRAVLSEYHDDISFSLNSHGYNYFDIDTQGNIFVSQRIDYDSIGVSSLILSVDIDKFNRIIDSTSIGSISLLPVDEAPTSLVQSQTFSIDETAGDDGEEVYVGYILVNDPDSQDHRNSAAFNFSLAPDETRFRIDSSGRIYTVGSGFDFDASPNLNIAVTATDINDASLVVSSNFNVQVRYVDPNAGITFSINSSLDIAEEMPIGTVVGQAVLSSSGEGLSFNLTDASNSFEVDANGVITTTRNFNYDVGQTGPYPIQLSLVETGGGLLDEHLIEIRVTPVDEMPTGLVQDQAFEIDETAGENNEEVYVGRIFVDDPDVEDNRNPAAFNFSLAPSETRFRIDNAGRIYTVGSDFDFDTAPNLNIAVTATDVNDASLFVSNNFNVQVGYVDPNEGITVNVNPLLTVDEESPIGTVVGQAQTSFEGEGISYVLLGGSVDFNIDDNGRITTAREFDADQGQINFSLTVQISDASNIVLDNSSPFTISINPVDEAPTSISLLGDFSIDDDAEGNQLVGGVLINDPDFDDHRNLSAFTYTLSGEGSELFLIDVQGRIYTAANSFDADAQGFYNLTVTARDVDNPALSVSGPVRVEINSANEAPSAVQFTGTRSITENIGSPIEVARAQASDDGDLVYSFTTAQSHFAIDPITGRITTTRTFNYEDFTSDPTLDPVFTLGVRATELGQEGLSSTSTVDITLHDVNEIPNAVNFEPSVLTIPEYSDDNTVIAVISGSDPDLDDTHSNLTYELTIDGGGRFWLDGSTIRVNDGDLLNIADFGSEFLIGVRVTDDEGLSSVSTGTVTVLNVEEAPIIHNPFSNGVQTWVSVSELIEPGDLVTTINASDPDGDPLSYELIPATSNDRSYLYSISANGEVRVSSAATRADFDTGQGPDFLTVNVADSQGLNTTRTLRVGILDEPELPDDLTWGIYRQALVGTTRTSNIDETFHINYLDSGQQTTVSSIWRNHEQFTTPEISIQGVGSYFDEYDIQGLDFSIVGGSAANYFVLENNNLIYSSTGITRAAEYLTNHTLQIRASLENDPSQSITRTLNFSVVNNSAPEVIASEPGILVNEANPSDQSTYINLYDARPLFSDPDGDSINYVDVTLASDSIVEITADIIRQEIGTWYSGLSSHNRDQVTLFRDFSGDLIIDSPNFYNIRSYSGQVAVNPDVFDYEWYSMLINEGEDLLTTGRAHSWQLEDALEDLTYSTTFNVVAVDGEARGLSERASVQINIADVSDTSAQNNAEQNEVLYRVRVGFGDTTRDVDVTLDDIRNQRISSLLNQNLSSFNTSTATAQLTPVVLDLNDDGFNGWRHQVFFDANSSGILNSTRWAGPEDGILALDGNGNGTIDNASEISFVDDLVGSLTDLEGLRAYDSNNDGILDVQDERFSDFVVWQDLNSDGISDEGELNSLTASGIASINLQLQENNSVVSQIEGISIPFVSTFTRSDGSTGQLADVGFEYGEDGLEITSYTRRIIGSDGNDELIGTASHDHIYGEGGDDIIVGGDGNDRLYATAGYNYLDGGAGDDHLVAYSSTYDISQVLVDTEGNNSFITLGGAAEVFAGSGDDSFSIWGPYPVHTIHTGSGHDMIRLAGLWSGSHDEDSTLTVHSSEGSSYNVQIFTHHASQSSTIGFVQEGANLVITGEGSFRAIFVDALVDGLASLPITSISFAALGEQSEWDLARVQQEISAALYGTIEGTSDDDELSSNLESATYSGYGGNDTITGGLGDDVVYGHEDSDTINTAEGNDWIDAGSGTDRVTAGEGDDTVYAGEGDDKVYGNGGNDVIHAGNGVDEIYGGEGNDHISGQLGNDILFGGSGNNTISGGAGNDIIFSEGGDDELYGDAGDDVIDAGAGADTIFGGSGIDQVFARDGDDIIDLGDGDDWLVAGSGADIASGGAGDDGLQGEDGNDILYGDQGDDRLNGGAGNDYLSGAEGADVLEGGLGADVIDGGAGLDTLRFSRGDGTDTVVVDIASTYVLQLIGIANTELSWGFENTEASSYTVLNLGGGDSIRFEAAPGLVLDPHVIVSSIQFEDEVTGQIIGQEIPETLNTSPEAQNDAITVFRNETTRIDFSQLLINDNDVDGDLLTIRSVANVVNASVVLDQENRFIDFTPLPGFVGITGFYYEASDGRDGLTTASVSVEVIRENTAPAAQNDSESTLEGTAVVLNIADLLANDIDGDVGDNLNITSVLNAVGGTAVLDVVADTITFTPDTGFTGDATFDYTVEDSSGASDIAQVTVAVTPLPLEPFSQRFETENGLVTAPTELVTASNLSGGSGAVMHWDGSGAIEWSIDLPSSGEYEVDLGYYLWVGTGETVLLIDGVEMGRVTSVGNEAWHDSIESSFGTFTLSGGEHSFMLAHGGGGFPDLSLDYIDVELISESSTPFNTPPVLGLPLADNAVDEDTAFNFTVPSDTFNDADGDTLTYSAAPTGGGDLPTWLSFDAATRTFSGTPENGDVGVLDVRVTADDGNGGTVTDDFTLTINNTNDSPVAGDDSDSTIEDTVVVVNIADLLGNDSDVDAGDSLRITSVLNAVGGTAALDIVAGTIIFTPDAEFNGSASFDYVVEDGQGGSDTATVSIDVTPQNDAPVVSNALIEQSTDEDVLFNFTVPSDTFNDTDGDALTYSAALAGGGDLPTWLSFDAATRTFSGTPENGDVGVLDVRVTADDSNGGTVTDDFSLTINNTNDAPVAQDDNDSTAEDTAVVMNVADLLVNDSDVDVGDSLSITSVANAVGGAVVLDAVAGTITFTPDAGFSGAASFDYVVEDSDGASGIAQVTIAVSPTTPPPLEPFNQRFETENGLVTAPAEIVAESNLSGGSGAIMYWNGSGAVEWSIDLPSSGEYQVDLGYYLWEGTGETILLVDGVEMGRATSLGNATWHNSIETSFGAFTLSEGEHTFTLMHGGGILPSLDYIDVELIAGSSTPSNTAPVLGLPLADNAVDEDTAFNFTVPSDTFNDTDGDTLTYSAAPTGGGDLPTWLSFDDATRTFSGTPENGDVGVLDVRVTADDGNGGTVTDDFSLTINNTNDAPVAQDDSDSTTEDTAIVLNIADLRANDTDVDAGDSDNLSISSVLNAVGGTAVLDTVAGTITFTPDTGFSGAASFDYVVEDSDGASDIAQVTIAVEPATPPPLVPFSQRFETESGLITAPTDVVTASNLSGGSGAVMFWDGSGAIEWSIDLPSSGEYQVDLGYYLWAGTGETVLLIDGVEMGRVTSVGNETWHDSIESSFGAFTLSGGEHSFVLAHGGGFPDLTLDYIDVELVETTQATSSKSTAFFSSQSAALIEALSIDLGAEQLDEFGGNIIEQPQVFAISEVA